MATVLDRPLRRALMPKVSTWTDWMVSMPTRANSTPSRAEIQPRTMSLPISEPQMIRPNRQKRKTSHWPNLMATLATKGWMKNTMIMDTMQAKMEEYSV